MIVAELLPKYDCATCTDSQKRERGCEGNALLPVQIDGEDQWTCPRRPIYENPRFYSHLFRYYRAYRDGKYPEEGGLKSQPAKLLDYFAIIDKTLDECREREN